MERLPALPAGWVLVRLESCSSSNDEARHLAEQGRPARTVVWALQQDGGRGRRGRSWVSPPGNLYCSLLLRPPVSAADAAQLSFVAAVAVAETISAFIPGQARLKWPNDVLVDGGKISGILLESEPGSQGRVEWLVLGVGINVRHHPAGLDQPATDLLSAGAVSPDLALVLQRFVESFDRWYDRWQIQGFAPIRAAWLNAGHRVGTPLRVRLSETVVTGDFVDLDASGALLLQTADGLRLITAGDVSAG